MSKEVHTHLDIPPYLWAIIIGIIFMVVGWFATPLGSGFQALIFIVGLFLLIIGIVKAYYD